jgi:exopolysaccharide biosynthesis predicted pyruvyltransferase EpsI
VTSKDLKAAKKLMEDNGYSAELWEFPQKGYPNYTDKRTGETWNDYRKIMPNRLPPKNPANIDVESALRVQVGFDLFSRGRVIIADRLHVTMMAILLDKPVI